MNNDRQDEIDDLQVELAKARAGEAHWRKVATASLCELSGEADPDIDKAYALIKQHRKEKRAAIFEAAQRAMSFSVMQTDAEEYRKELARLKGVNADLRRDLGNSVEEIKDLKAKHEDKLASLNVRYSAEVTYSHTKRLDEVLQAAKERGELDALLLRVARMMNNGGE